MKRLWGIFRWYTSLAGLRQIALAMRHIGGAVECPFCGWRGNRFYPHPEPHPRPNALCPRCSSKERHRLLYLYLRSQTSFFQRQSRVLEIAPEPYSRRLISACKDVQYASMDLESSLAQCHGDITSLPYRDRAFDYAFCYHVFEHIQQDGLAMGELRRVLKPGGVLFAHVPIVGEVTYEDSSITDPKERTRIFGQQDHVRMYGGDFRDRLTRAGFQVDVNRYASSLTPNELRRYGVLSEDVIYVCSAMQVLD